MSFFKHILSVARLSFAGQDRGAFRFRRILMSAVSILGAKGISLFVMLISVPLTYSYLGEERFGLLMLVLSLIMLMTFADLGLGYGLLNRIATYDVAGDIQSLKKAVSSTFFFLLATGLIIITIFISVHAGVPWSTVFNVTSPVAQLEAGWTILVFALCFCLTLPFTLVAKFQAGYQENHINQLWEAAGNICSLIALVIVVRLEAGVPYILLALYGSQCAFVIFNFCFQFLIRRPHLLPSLRNWDTQVFRGIFKDAVLICGLQIFSMLINAIDSVLIARYVDPIAVGAYAIGYRLFAVFILPVQAFLSSILPAFNDAIAGRDLAWIRKGLKASVVGVLVLSLTLSILFIVSANTIIGVWVAPDAHLGLPLVIAFGSYVVYQNMSSLLFNVMMTPVFLRKLFMLYGISAVVIVALKIIFISSWHYSSILWATILGATVCFLVPGYTLVYHRLRSRHNSLSQMRSSGNLPDTLLKR